MRNALVAKIHCIRSVLWMHPLDMFFSSTETVLRSCLLEKINIWRIVREINWLIWIDYCQVLSYICFLPSSPTPFHSLGGGGKVWEGWVMYVHVSHSFSFEFKFLQISNHRKSRSALSNCHIPPYSILFHHFPYSILFPDVLKSLGWTSKCTMYNLRLELLIPEKCTCTFSFKCTMDTSKYVRYIFPRIA